MKQKYGNISRVFMTEQPAVYDKQTRIVYMDFQPDKQLQSSSTVDSGKTKTNTKETAIAGFSGFVIQTDGIIDYAHIKSQLVEAAFPQKEEHALAFNTLDALMKKIDGEELSEDQLDDIAKYKDFAEFRTLCANCAKAIMSLFN